MPVPEYTFEALNDALLGGMQREVDLRRLLHAANAQIAALKEKYEPDPDKDPAAA